MKKKLLAIVALLLCAVLTLSSCTMLEDFFGELFGGGDSFDLSSVPEFDGTPYVNINDGKPEFTDEEITAESYEFYSELDVLGRCGVTHACIGRDLMPTDDREEIGSVYPSGWKYNGKSNNNKYDTTLVEAGYIYNRCHLIGFQLAGENANEKNLITGTRYLNIEGMLPFENMIADYVKETGNHVMFKVTPIYNGNDLVPKGVHMMGYSVEDEGKGISFNVYAYNAQPGIEINYATGENWLSGEELQTTTTTTQDPDTVTYVLNTNSKKFHKHGSSCGDDIKAENRDTYTGNRQNLLDQGYTPCGTCKP